MEQPKTEITITKAMSDFVEITRLARSANTWLTYGKALNEFKTILHKAGIDPETSSTSVLTEELIPKLIAHLNASSPATERLYVGTVGRFYKYLVAEQLANINLPRVSMLIQLRTRRPGVSIPDFPTTEMERLINSVLHPEALMTGAAGEELETVKLRAYRDRAFIITLADTGLRVHEACKLRRGDLNWNEQYAIITGKGNKQAVVRFSGTAIQVIKDYLACRAALDGNSGRQLTSLPVFARHDKGAGKKVRPITPTTGRNIVRERVEQFLGMDMVGRITPHSFRHYFVTSVLRGTGNLKYAQELARHKSSEVTERYIHLANDELDKAYHEVFEKNSKWRTE